MDRPASEWLLPSPWTLRGHCESDGSSYKVNYFHILDLTTIEDWVHVRNALRPGQVFCDPHAAYRLHGRTLSSVSLFRDDIRPEWEDPRNCNGFTHTMRGSLDAHEADRVWDDLVLELVRGAMPPSVVGVQLIRKWSRQRLTLKLDVWSTSDGTVQKTAEILKALFSWTGLALTLTERTVR